MPRAIGGKKFFPAVKLLVSALLFLGLYLTAEFNFLLYHALVEIFSIIIAASIFVVAWNARRLIDQHYLLFLGIAYLFVGTLDLIHTFSYKGMGIFPDQDANLATQLWISARYLESISLLIAPVFLTRKLDTRLAFLAFGLVLTLLLSTIFSGTFPACFIEESGLTAFKKTSEYLISVMLLIAMMLFVRNAEHLEKDVLRLLVLAIVFSIGAELSFTLYISVYGITNFIGHVFKIISFYLVYKALVETGLKRPYDLLYRDLKLSEERYRKIYDIAPLAFVVWDKQCRITGWNKSAENIFGWTEEAVLGRNLFEFLIPEGLRPKIEQVVGSLLRGTLANQSINQNLTKSGKIILCEWNNSIIYDNNGNVTGAISLGLDITERKKAEKLLETASEKIKIFAYSVSHDLKSPAISIHKLSELLYKRFGESLTEKGRLFCEGIMKSSEQLAALVDQINIFIASEETPLTIEEINLQEIFQTIEDEFSQGLEERQIVFTRPEALLPRIRADRLGLIRIIRNLVDNALKYGGEGLKTIEVSYSEQPEYHVITVRDDGVGIKSHETEHIFRIFNRRPAAAGTTGAGLGLAIVKEIASLHNGDAWVEPGGNQGSVFSVSISKYL